MGGQNIELTVQERTVKGKTVKHLRKDGLVPAVIHDHGNESKVVMVPHADLIRVYREAGKHHPLQLTLGKDGYMALIKDVDFDPKKHQLRHVVFNAIKQDQEVETEVPVILDGEIPAEKAGLMIITTLDRVEVKALPKDLIDELKVDATTLVEIGDKIHVSDIAVPAGVTIMTEPEQVVAGVEETKAQISEEEESAEGEEGEETGEGETPEGQSEGGESKAKEASEEE